MFKPSFQRTDLLIEMIGRIEAARTVVLRAPIAVHWESQLRHEGLVRSAHHSTSYVLPRPDEAQTPPNEA